MPRFLVAEQVQANVFGRDGVVQFKILVGQDVVGFVADRGAEFTRPVNSYRMAGRIDSADGLVGNNLYADALRLQRQVGVEVAGLGVNVVEEAIVRGQDLAVFNLDAPLVAGRDGENVGLDGPVPTYSSRAGSRSWRTISS